MQPRILLIEPPFFRFKGANSEIFPIGLGYVASLLHKNNYFVKVYNGEQFSEAEATSVVSYQDLLDSHKKFIAGLHDNNHFIWREVQEYIKKYKPTIIGMGTTTTKMKSALKIAEIAKSLDSNIKIVIGGLHATIMPDDILKSNNVDFAVRGEGEFTFLELVQALENGTSVSHIKGLSYIDSNGKEIKNPDRQFLEDLDALPFPDKNLIIEEQKAKAKYQIIFCSRGCPYRCNYCNTASIWGRKVRYHSVPRIIEEIKRIKEQEHTNHIQFFDDTFTLSPPWVTELCTAMIKEDLQITWSCLTRLDRLDEKLLMLMKQAGCNGIAMGVESGSQRVLDSIKKDITLEKIFAGQDIINKVGISWDAFIMLGMPYETKDDMYATLLLMKKLQCRSIILSVFTPYPGTELYDVTKEMGLLSTDKDWEKYSDQSAENSFNKNVSAEEYKLILQEAVRIADRKNLHFKDLFHKAYRKKNYFLKHPQEFIQKMAKVMKSVV